MSLPVVHEFAYGPVNPVLAYIFSFLGALFGLTCAARARQVPPGRRRVRWLVIAAVAIGGEGVWLMHFMAMLGFDVPAATIRYNLVLTVASLIIAVAAVTAGLFIAAYTTPTPTKVILGGLFTGGGVAAMHYTGMAAMHLDYAVSYDRPRIELSVGVAVVAAIASRWCAVSVRRRSSIAVAAAILAAAVCGMHYVGMYALSVHGAHEAITVSGLNPLLFLLPITVVTTATVIGLGVLSLDMATDEDFHLNVPPVDARTEQIRRPRRRRHASS